MGRVRPAAIERAVVCARSPLRAMGLAVALSAPWSTMARAEVAMVAEDSSGKLVQMARSHASVERTPPERAETGGSPPDPDALRYVVAGTSAELPQGLRIVSSEPSGAKLDELEVTLSPWPCPPSMGPQCRATPLVRVVPDDIDRAHPLVRDRSILGEVGGKLGFVYGT